MVRCAIVLWTDHKQQGPEVLRGVNRHKILNKVAVLALTLCLCRTPLNVEATMDGGVALEVERNGRGGDVHGVQPGSG
jgi:hypothetical protein